MCLSSIPRSNIPKVIDIRQLNTLQRILHGVDIMERGYDGNEIPSKDVDVINGTLFEQIKAMKIIFHHTFQIILHGVVIMERHN